MKEIDSINYLGFFIKGWKEGRLITKTIKEKKYYTHIEDLPVYNFFKIKSGKYEYLWKYEKDRDKPYPKGLFLSILQEMYFQFPKLDNTYLRNLADLADYESKWIRTKNFRWKNEMNTLKKKIEDTKSTELNLDDFTDYIEHTFKNPVGSLDVYKVSTSKAFNNYYKAIEKNKITHANN